METNFIPTFFLSPQLKDEGGKMDYQNVIEEWRQIAEDFFAARGDLFEEVVSLSVEKLRAGRKILIFGNGGSAAQAQHFAAELVNKFLKERAPIRAISLTTDTSSLTSIANDISYDYVFSRQIEALGDKEDVVLGLSTSGNSPNVMEAMKVAKERGLLTVAFTGKGGGKLSSLADYLLDVSSESTPKQFVSIPR